MRFAELETMQDAEFYVSDIGQALQYRPELFAAPFTDLLQALTRGDSAWSTGERELLAAFVSAQRQCPFWTESHGAVASSVLGAELVDAILADYETAPIDEKLRATLHFLVTFDPSRAFGAGVSRAALRDAVEVKAAFDVITRFADTIGATPGSERGLTREQVLAGAAAFYERGYVWGFALGGGSGGGGGIRLNSTSSFAIDVVVETKDCVQVVRRTHGDAAAEVRAVAGVDCGEVWPSEIDWGRLPVARGAWAHWYAVLSISAANAQRELHEVSDRRIVVTGKARHHIVERRSRFALSTEAQ